jgi:hypothetical protein
MKRSGTRVLIFLGATCAALGAGRMAAAQSVPTDASGGCPIPPTTVATFFETGTVSLNGVAKPADSTVSLTPNCGFFQWSEQMFLWLTSPAPATRIGARDPREDPRMIPGRGRL